MISQMASDLQALRITRTTDPIVKAVITQQLRLLALNLIAPGVLSTVKTGC